MWQPWRHPGWDISYFCSICDDGSGGELVEESPGFMLVFLEVDVEAGDGGSLLLRGRGRGDG